MDAIRRSDFKAVQHHVFTASQCVGDGQRVDPAALFGDLALHRACEVASSPIVEFLIMCGAVVNNAVHSQEGALPLHYAAFYGSTHCVELLLRHRADPSKPGSNGYTPLMDAARQGQVDCVKLLLAYKASVNMRTSTRQTALDLAFSERESRPIIKPRVDACLELLKEAGATESATAAKTH